MVPPSSIPIVSCFNLFLFWLILILIQLIKKRDPKKQLIPCRIYQKIPRDITCPYESVSNAFEIV